MRFYKLDLKYNIYYSTKTNSYNNFKNSHINYYTNQIHD